MGDEGRSLLLIDLFNLWGKRGHFFPEVNKLKSHQGKCFPGGWLEVCVCGSVCPNPWPHLCWLRVTQPCSLSLCSRLSLPRLFGATTFLEMRTKGRGLSTPASLSRPHKSNCNWAQTPELVLDLTAGRPARRHKMALSTQIQATCLLLLLLASLTSASVLSHQTTQLADLQTQDTTGAKAGLMPGLRRLRRRDTHFPICMYCCGCCYKSRCGLCCKT